MQLLQNVSIMHCLPGNDFNNATVNFTIASGTLDVAINVGDIIRNDTVNEAEEIFIIVLEVTENGGVDIAFDEEAGILVYEIQDNNPINLILRNNGSTSFPESFGTIANVLTVEKESGSPETEVDIPINVTITGSGTVIEGNAHFHLFSMKNDRCTIASLHR
jgi:hypothetical protein